MNPALPILRQNLQEIWSAVGATEHDEAKRIPLVPNYSGTHVYDARAGYGRLWRWFFTIACFLFGNGCKNERLIKAIEAIHTMFQTQAEQLQETARKYKTALQNIGEGRDIDEASYLSIKKEIIEWNESTKPFVKLMQKHTDPRTKEITHIALKNLFHIYLEPNTELAFTSSNAKRLILCQKIIDFENYYAPFNHKLLRPLLQLTDKIFVRQEGRKLNEAEGKIADDWIKSLNETTPSLIAFRRGVESLTQLFQSIDRPQTHGRSMMAIPSTALHTLLETKRCKIYQQTEEKLVERIGSFTTGSVINFDNRQYTIDMCLQSTDFKKNIFFYTLKNRPNQILLAGKNKLLLPMFHYFDLLQKQNTGAPSAFQDTSSCGSYTILHGYIPVQGYEWQSPPSGVSDKDLTKARSIAKYIEKCIKENKTPKDLLEKPWFFTVDGELAYLDTIGDEVLNFNALEDFAFRCSAGNEAVRKFLLHTSGLFKHVLADYYRIIVKSAVDGTELDLTTELRIHSRSDPRIIQRATELKEELSKHIDICTRGYLNEDTNTTQAIARKKGGAYVHWLYMKSETIGNIIPFEWTILALV